MDNLTKTNRYVDTRTSSDGWNLQRSRELFARASKSIPGGVTSDVRLAGKPFPMFFERGDGAMLYDVDGNGYIDYMLGQGPLILGHSPPAVLDAVEQAMRRGQIFAGQHELEVEAAEAIVERVPGAELCRFSLSGSEVVQAAIRLARAATGRKKVLRFEGHYHGWFDSVLVSVAPPLDDAGPRERPVAVGMTSGQAASALDEVVVLPWNDLDLIEIVFAEHGDDLAAVIMEPVMCNSGAIPPVDGFLEGVRDYCDRYGVVLIFDEVITGFRLAPGGAQELFGVTPDLATYGKALAAGFPSSALAGKRELMQRLGHGVNHSGTFNGNLISMAATVASLTELNRDDGAAYRKIERTGSALMQGIRDIAKRLGLPVLVQGFPPAFHVAFTEQDRIADYRDCVLYADSERYSAFALALLERGVRVLERGLWYVSAAHDDEHVERTLAAVEESLEVAWDTGADQASG